MEPVILPFLDLFIRPKEAFQRLRGGASLQPIAILFAAFIFVDFFFSSRFYTFNALKIFEAYVARLDLHLNFITIYTAASIARVGLLLLWTWLAFKIGQLVGGKGEFKDLLTCFLFIELTGSILRDLVFVSSFSKLFFAPLVHLRHLDYLVACWEIYLSVICLMVISALPVNKAIFTFVVGKLLKFVGLLSLLGVIFFAILMKRGFPKISEDRLGQPTFESMNQPADLKWEMRSLEGKTFTLDDARGKIVFLNIWATWCPPCVAEMPSIQRAYDKLKNEDILFICVSSEDEKTVRKFQQKNGYTFPIYTMGGPLPEVFSTRGIPATFLITPRGDVIARHVGAAKWDSVEALAYLENLLPAKSKSIEYGL